LGPRIREVAPIGPCGGGPRRPPEAALSRRLSRVAPLGSPLGGGANRAARGDLALAIRCWRSPTGALGRTCAGDTFQGPVPEGNVPGVALIGPPHSGGGTDWTPWKWSSSSTGGGSRAILAGGPVGVAAWGHSLGGGPNLAACGDLALAITCWRSLTGALRRARTGDTLRGPVSGAALIGPPHLGGGPDWISFRGWPSLGPRIWGVAPIGSGSVGPRPIASGRLSRVTPVWPRVVSSPGQPHLGAL
jgi:hypothetical protein